MKAKVVTRKFVCMMIMYQHTVFASKLPLSVMYASHHRASSLAHVKIFFMEQLILSSTFANMFVNMLALKCWTYFHYKVRLFYGPIVVYSCTQNVNSG